MTISDMACGKAGEYLVCADLILSGHVAFPSEQGLCFDVMAVIKNRLYRIQVKTTRGPRIMPQRKTHHPVNLFHVKRMGKGGIKRYGAGDVDLFALVALDTKTIGYFRPSSVRDTMIFRLKDLSGSYLGEKFSVDKERIASLRASGMTFTAIGVEIGMDRAQAHRIYHADAPDPRWRYLEDFSLEKAIDAT